MPAISSSVSVAASGVNENVLAGSQWEFMPFDGMLEIGLCGDANGADLAIDIFTGTDIELEGSRANTQNRMPVYPDDFPVMAGAAAGDRLKIRVRNTSAAGARTLFYTVRIMEMA